MYFLPTKVLKGYVRKGNMPKGCIAQCYVAEEALEYCTKYLDNLEAIGVQKIKMRGVQQILMATV